MSSDLPFTGETELLRCVFTYEIKNDGSIFSSAFSPKGVHDMGLLSTEHGARPDGAAGYLAECEYSDIDGIYAVTVNECVTEDLPYIDDGGEDGKSPCHVSIDFRGYLTESVDQQQQFNLNKPGKRKARALAKYADARTKRA